MITVEISPPAYLKSNKSIIREVHFWQRPAHEVEKLARKSNEVNQPKGLELRESDNPIIEDFKEELLRRPSIGPRSIISSDAQRLAKLEGIIADMHERITKLEQRIKVLEGKN